MVTHSAFLRHMLPLLGQADEHFDNCEMRSFVLVVDGALAAGFAAHADLKMRVEAGAVEAGAGGPGGGGQGAEQGAEAGGSGEGAVSAGPPPASL